MSLPFNEALSPVAAAKLSQVCDQFEASWKSGGRPSIEDFLQGAGDSQWQLLLRELLIVEWTYVRIIGITPILDEYLVRFAEHRELIARLFHDFTLDANAATPGAKSTAADRSQTIDFVAPATWSTPWPNVPGHEILGVLGQGGMGVVYKAQQLALKRHVAIKTILSGARASETERARFHREAEAVASLQHPHIVQIHEIGEHDGNLYITLELVEGGSLAKKLGRQPQPAVTAANQVETLARAIHYAHQRGIVHRDLKPSNVLLSADGTLKITDFGVAKHLGADQGQTRTGAVVGTPSYMAPEQAEGRADAISPLMDVYALGAILYQMLTGQPPFVGDSDLDVLRQVVSQEPIPPTRRQPRIPRDLETICLKALAKAPQQRYASAEALADDLARFQAGEPIRARRTSRLVRAGRYLRRRPLALALLAVLFGAALLSAYLLFQGRAYNRTDALMQHIDREIERPDWMPEHVETLEPALAELEQLDSDKVRVARNRVNRRTTEVIRQSFAMAQKPVLRDEDIRTIEGQIALLAKRDASLAEETERAFQTRLRESKVIHLRFPFDGLAEVFQPADVQISDRRLAITAGNEKSVRWIATRIPSQGKVEMTVRFAAKSWEKADALHLKLNLRNDQGYTFTLLPLQVFGPAAPTEAEKQTTFAAAKKSGGLIRARILRDQDVLREEDFRPADLPDGALELTAGRDGDRLSLQFNQRPPVIFFDSFPARGPDPGVFALRCPHGTLVEQVAFSHQLLPAFASPLERGDLLYAEGQHSEALKFYQLQETLPVGTPAGQEVRYKRGVCLLALNRLEEAAPLFEEVFFADGPRWPALAGCQLWSIRFRQRNYGEVDAIFLKLSARHPPSALVSMVPVEVRAHFFLAFTVDYQRTEFLRFDPQRVSRLERITSLADAIRIDHRRRLQLGLAMVRAYHLEGQFEPATEYARKMLQDPGPTAPSSNEVTNVDYRIRMCEEFSHLLRLQGRAKEALAEVDSRLFAELGAYQFAYWPLLLERARLHVALNQWDKAESDLETFFSKDEILRRDYRYYAEASLLLGFLRERKNDLAAAKAAWAQGVHSNWLERRSKAYLGETFTDEPLAGVGFITHLVLASLADELTEQDTKLVTRMAITHVVDESSSFLFQDLFKVPVSLFCKGWQSARGMNAARTMAYKNTTWSDYIRMAPILTGFSFVRQNALPANASAEQEELAWQVAEKILDAALTTGKLGKAEVLALALTWKGVTGSFGWAGVAPKLEPDMRGLLAYVMGHRLLRLNNAEAQALFRTALNDAPPNSVLQRLAQAEIDRLKK